MNLDINLLPEEYKTKPLIDTRTLLLAVIVVALIATAFFLFQSKNSIDADIEELEKSIANIEKQIAEASDNPELAALENELAAVEKEAGYFPSFMDSRILWGKTIEHLYYDLVPMEITINGLTQNGSTLNINGVAPSYTALSNFGRTINLDPQLALTGMPPYTASGSFTLIVQILESEPVD